MPVFYHPHQPGTIGRRGPLKPDGHFSKCVLKSPVVPITLFFQSLSAAITTFVGSTVKKTSVPVAASTASLAGSTIKKTSVFLSGMTASLSAVLVAAVVFIKAFAAATSALSGSLNKKSLLVLAANTASLSASLVKKTLSFLIGATSALSGLLIKKFLFSLAGSTTSLSGLIAKKTFTPIAATTALFSGSLVKKTFAALAATTASLAGSVIKRTEVVLSSALSSFSGVLIEAIVFVKTFAAATASFSGSLIKKSLLVLASSTAGLVGVVTKQGQIKLGAASSSFSGFVVKRTAAKLTSATAVFAAVVNKMTQVKLAAQLFSFVGTIRKSISVAFSSAMASFSAGISEGSQSFQKSLSAVLSIFSAIFTVLKIVPEPSVIVPVVMGQSVVAGWGLTFQNPAVIQTSSNGMNMFFRPDQPDLIVQEFGTPNNWGLLGQRAMPNELMVAPRNGYANNGIFVAGSGDITIPLSAVDGAIQFTLNQNYFSLVGQKIIITTDTLATLNVPLSLSPGTWVWSFACTLYQVGQTILAQYTIIIDGISYSASGFSVRPTLDPRIQLSFGAQFLGSVSGSDQFQIRATQLELQQ